MKNIVIRKMMIGTRRDRNMLRQTRERDRKKNHTLEPETEKDLHKIDGT